MNRKILIICVDGMGPDYLEAAPTPNIDRMAKEGASVQGRSVIPSVTNVNNVSIITGTAPKAHGITGNYWFNHATGEENYMESAEFLLAPTILSRAREHGLRTALLTAKKKLLNLLNAGTDYAVSAEQPDASEEALACLNDVPGVEEVYSRDVASREFGLMPDRIGDIFVLGDKDTVFGDFESPEVPVGVRSHGSRHESAVPIIAFRVSGPITYGRNLDIVRTLDIQGLPS